MLVHRRVTPPALCRQYPFIHLGGERQSGVKFLVYGNNAMGEALTPDLQIDREFEVLTTRPHTHPQAQVLFLGADNDYALCYA